MPPSLARHRALHPLAMIAALLLHGAALYAGFHAAAELPQAPLTAMMHVSFVASTPADAALAAPSPPAPTPSRALPAPTPRSESMPTARRPATPRPAAAKAPQPAPARQNLPATSAVAAGESPPAITAASDASPASAATSQASLPFVEPRFDAAYLANPRPSYPPVSRRLGEQGKVILRVRVGADGSPRRVELEQSSGYPRLDRAARDAVERWKFVPARRGDTPVEATVLVPIAFSLSSS